MGITLESCRDESGSSRSQQSGIRAFSVLVALLHSGGWFYTRLLLLVDLGSRLPCAALSMQDGRFRTASCACCLFLEEIEGELSSDTCVLIRHRFEISERDVLMRLHAVKGFKAM